MVCWFFHFARASRQDIIESRSQDTPYTRSAVEVRVAVMAAREIISYPVPKSRGIVSV